MVKYNKPRVIKRTTYSNNYKTIKFTHAWYGEVEIYFVLHRYYATNQLAIQAMTKEGEPWATITTCILNTPLVTNYGENTEETIIDTNNCEGIMSILETYNLCTMTGRTARSGFCSYPIVRMNMDELLQYCAFADI